MHSTERDTLLIRVGPQLEMRGPEWSAGLRWATGLSTSLSLCFSLFVHPSASDTSCTLYQLCSRLCLC